MFSKISYLTIIGLLCWTLTAIAAPITYIYTGTGSGTIGGTPFANAAFTISGQADTNDIVGTPGNFQEVNHLSTSISITGVGTYAISSLLRTFFVVSSSVVGLSRQAGGDLYDLQGILTGWELGNSWGPVNTSGSLFQWSSPAVNTSGGVLVFQDQYQAIGTFQAIRGQEPASIPTLNEWGMILFALLLSGATIWRFRKYKRNGADS